MEDSANGILGCIDDLWKIDDYHFPQDEMDRLLGISSIPNEIQQNSISFEFLMRVNR